MFPDFESYTSAQRESMRRALAHPLSEHQKRLRDTLFRFMHEQHPDGPPSPLGDYDPLTVDGAYWRGWHGMVNIHAPGCDAFAAWRAGYARGSQLQRERESAGGDACAS